MENYNDDFSRGAVATAFVGFVGLALMAIGLVPSLSGVVSGTGLFAVGFWVGTPKHPQSQNKKEG